jgi:lipopolysaccharide transport system permease protein
VIVQTFGPRVQRQQRWPLQIAARAIWANRELAWEMGRRELLVLSKGAVLGIAWQVIRPFLQVLSYVLVVSVIFGVHAGPSNGGPFSYALYVLSGMVPWQLLTTGLQDAPSLIRSRIDLLRQIVYPLEILPLTSLIVAAVGPAVTLLVYLAIAAGTGQLHWSILLLPIPILLLVAMLVGCAWVLMVVGTLLVDLREIVGVFLGILVYMSPVVLSADSVPAPIWRILQFNPLFHVVVCFRDVFSADFHLISWAVFVGSSVAALLVGSAVVLGAKRMFAELL